ncbi:MAG: hypothetical protein JO348_15545 [Alphaproteobacteria bacterium]|nr:hypothetical protein [Alphaproteobacteria bacterium]MBV9540831.1 hypothetical protein [Alphaproteobacteria bacterium]
MPPGGKEIYVEFLVQGSVVKATAIDPATGVEVSVVGPSGAPRGPLTEAAVRKLQYVLKKKSGG